MPDKLDLTNEQTIFLRKIARKNWAFFKTFVRSEDNWLPIDNFQEHPTAKIAHRTSPTTIGYGLLTNLAAYDFGYITSTRFVERVTNTFNTMDLLERYQGHFYNWYDTQSLESLKPIYISTVDSGNLAGCLLTLQAALLALADKNIIDLKLFTGLQDTLTVFSENIVGVADQAIATGQANIALLIAQFQMNLQAACQSLPNLIEARIHLERLTKCAEEMLTSVHDTEFGEAHWWAQALYDECSDALSEFDFLLPWMSVLSGLDRSDSLKVPDQPLTIRYLADLESSSTVQLSKRLLGSVISKITDERLKDLEALIVISRQRARTRITVLEELVYRSNEFARMQYGFLFDETRQLFAIGYNLSENSLDSARYDLLASESRFSYFIAIAQGQIPKESWFALGRNLTMIDGQYGLLSWNGSMLEYLMPLLVMPAYAQSLLGQTYQLAVKGQIAYATRRGVPWGVSASCYNSLDENLNYRYAPFGVPELGLKHGLADDLVIAPHATALALMVAPALALQNLERLSSLGFIGKYGFYEAIDYTPARVPAGQSHVIVRSFMAHHQGMTLLSLSKVLLERPMQELFETDPCFQAIMPLLQEPISLRGAL